jgi:hypothetical protein
MTWRTWLGAVVLFFAWGFVMHGAGLVLHEVGGHGVAAALFECGIDRVVLTYFGHGRVNLVPCASMTWTSSAIIDWAGLAVTIAAGAGAGVVAFRRRAGLTPLTRLLLALLATGFLLGQLSYATLGGFHDLYDPANTSYSLGKHGLHVLAWLPPLVLFAASAVLGARAIVDAFREHFGSRTRLHMLKQSAATLGTAGLLYLVAFRLEWAIRTDVPRGVTYTAERMATLRKQAPPFPLERVLLGIAVVAFVVALARPVRAPAGDGVPGPIDRHLAAVVAAAVVLIAVIWAFNRL